MDYKYLLKTNSKDRTIKANGIKKRLFNIKTFRNLDKTGLVKNVCERNLLIYETIENEKIYIHYPGKEVEDENPRKIRPWDFRPKLFDVAGNMMPDLSFKDIWDDIESLQNIDKDALSIVAALFFRCSNLIDTKLETSECSYYDIDMKSEKIISKGQIKIEWYKINIDTDLIKYLNNKIGKIRGFSFEAYLYYNDLLCQNEDCKYYYRDVVMPLIDDGINPNDESKYIDANWKTDIGRRNTYWTHMSVIGFLKGEIKFTQIMEMFMRGMGVGPIPAKLIPVITDGIIQ